ncbi:hypothetical protein GCM10007989_14960 [Devosia pacifica]|uniref:Uncharacterized protein n=1 Tax=Devosia pacifica TaxID=1335967 RepID=A0A918VSP6_9HYPH|nr:hypothetical protein [Devosia pacifica]GHA20825.1 hypothetical protein GCM10007989_14960 [Devosia pacifica]
MLWQLVAILAIVLITVIGFVLDERTRRREQRRPGPSIDIEAVNAQRRKVHDARRIAGGTAVQMSRRQALRSIGF